MLDNCGSVIWQDLTTLHDLGKMLLHIVIVKMYVGLIDESKTLTGILFWTQSESKINLILLSFIGSFHLFAAVNEKFQVHFKNKSSLFLLYDLGSSLSTIIKLNEKNTKKYLTF